MWNQVRSAYHFIRPAMWRNPNAPLYSGYDLRRLDYLYWNMYREHEALHRGLIAEIAPGSLLEVACGTGWNTANFAAFDYHGLDVSETALSLAMRKHPERKFINLGIADVSILRDQSFDVVYNSSMLEHIGYMETALLNMIRLARKHLYVMFFEGLDEESSRKFHPYTPTQISGEEKDIFGRKVVLQDHIERPEKGWYWNRYSRAEVDDLMRKHGCRYEILDKSNRPFIWKQSVLHVFI